MTEEILNKGNHLFSEIESLKLRIKIAENYHSDRLIDQNLLDECNKKIVDHLKDKLTQKETEFNNL